MRTDRDVDVVIGDLFRSSAQTWVNTVNTVGVMGKGIALAFRKRFPEMVADYEARCARGEVRLGRPYLYRRPSPPHVLNFPTKGHWRAASRLSDIVSGLEHLKRHYRDWGITSLAVPPLGCGNGGLEWAVVGPTLYQHLARFEIPVELYAPYGTPHLELEPRFLQQGLDMLGAAGPSTASRQLEPAWVAIVGALDRLQADPHHWPVGKTTLQKLVYFADVAGIPTGLEFEKGTYGPYSLGLSRVVSTLVNHDLIEQRQLGRMIAHDVGPTFEAASRAYRSELQHWDGAIERLADLLARLRTTRTAEVAATTHYAAAALARSTTEPPSEEEVVRAVMEWKQRKTPPLGPEEVAIAARSLAMLGWLELRPSPGLEVDDAALVGM
jgi:O-acetyl-ADP-ribose deacetylase (regulator of RNase III)